MDYNELKLAILETLAEIDSMDSLILHERLQEAKRITISVYALRMALMRYCKQGLLVRSRSGGLFSYRLTERGKQRLEWLRSQREDPEKRMADGHRDASENPSTN